MKKRSRLKRKIKQALFCAALSLVTVIQGTVVPYNYAYAAPEDSEESEEEASVGGEIMTDVFGRLIIYRWDHLTKDNYSKNTGKWVPVLVFSNSTYEYDSSTLKYNITFDRVLNPVAPDDIYLDNDHEYLDDACKIFGKNGVQNWPISSGEKMSTTGAATFQTGSTANNSDMKTNKETFYTEGNQNCMFLRYAGEEQYAKHPYFDLRLSNGKESLSSDVTDTMSAYYINLVYDKNDKGLMKISKNGHYSKTSKWSSGDPIVFQRLEFQNYVTGATTVFCEDPVLYDRNEDNPNIYFDMESNWAVGNATTSNFFRFYTGTRYCYSSLEDTTVEDGQILSVSAESYYDSDENEQTTNGVILKNGCTITVKSGGILSVSGDLINNGTIVIEQGGTLLIKDGGSIYPWRNGTKPSKNGCGAIKCNGGDIIIRKGGALYGGMMDQNGAFVPFEMDGGSVLINQGLLVYGTLKMGSGTRLECHKNSKTYGSYYQAKSYLEIQNIYNLGAAEIYDGDGNTVRKSTVYDGGLRYFDLQVVFSSAQSESQLKSYKSYLESIGATNIKLELASSAKIYGTEMQAETNTVVKMKFLLYSVLDQNEVLSSCNSYLNEGKTSDLKKKKIILQAESIQNNIDDYDIGLTVTDGTSEEKYPTIALQTSTEINDTNMDSRLTSEQLEI